MLPFKYTFNPILLRSPARVFVTISCIPTDFLFVLLNTVFFFFGARNLIPMAMMSQLSLGSADSVCLYFLWYTWGDSLNTRYFVRSPPNVPRFCRSRLCIYTASISVRSRNVLSHTPRWRAHFWANYAGHSQLKWESFVDIFFNSYESLTSSDILSSFTIVLRRHFTGLPLHPSPYLHFAQSLQQRGIPEGVTWIFSGLFFFPWLISGQPNTFTTWFGNTIL